ncbi:MAG: hypothetical protein ACK4I8_09675 [Armatimonadota bacterium]
MGDEKQRQKFGAKAPPTVDVDIGAPEDAPSKGLMKGKFNEAPLRRLS